MRLSVTVWFDATRGAWRARFRGVDLTAQDQREGRSYDRKLTVPARAFRQKSLSPTGDTPRHRRVAEEWAHDRKDELEAEITGERSSRIMSLAEIHGLYQDRNPFESKPATLKRNRNLARHLVAFFGARLPSTIDSGAAVDFRGKRIADGASGREIRNELSFLRTLLNLGHEWEVDTGLHRVRLTRLPSVEDDSEDGIALTFEEAREILRPRLHKHDARVKRIIVAGWCSMLRKTTLLRQRWEWIDAERRWRTIPRREMKGARAALSVPISGWEMAAIGRPKRSGAVFPGQYGGDRGTKTIEESLRTLSRRIGLQRDGLDVWISHHDLRYTGSTWLSQSGVPKLVRSVLMGHSLGGGANATDLYDLIDEARLREAVATFDAIQREHFGNIGRPWER